jgi:hypothetical protein
VFPCPLGASINGSEMSAGNANRLARRLRWVARVICLIITVFGAIMLVGAAISELPAHGSIETSLEGGLLVLIGIIALGGCIMSWWRDLPAGILLIVTSAGLGAHIGICAGRNHFMAWAMLGLPYLVAGGLLLYAWRLSIPKYQ